MRILALARKTLNIVWTLIILPIIVPWQAVEYAAEKNAKANQRRKSPEEYARLKRKRDYLTLFMGFLGIGIGAIALPFGLAVLGNLFIPGFAADELLMYACAIYGLYAGCCFGYAGGIWAAKQMRRSWALLGHGFNLLFGGYQKESPPAPVYWRNRDKYRPYSRYKPEVDSQNAQLKIYKKEDKQYATKDIWRIFYVLSQLKKWNKAEHNFFRLIPKLYAHKKAAVLKQANESSAPISERKEVKKEKLTVKEKLTILSELPQNYHTEKDRGNEINRHINEDLEKLRDLDLTYVDQIPPKEESKDDERSYKFVFDPGHSLEIMDAPKKHPTDAQYQRYPVKTRIEDKIIENTIDVRRIPERCYRIRLAGSEIPGYVCSTCPEDTLEHLRYLPKLKR